MIIDILLFVVSLFLWTISRLFGLIEFALPEEVTTAASDWMGNLAYTQGLFPLVPNPNMTGLAGSIGILNIVGYGLQFIVAWYLIKLILFAFGLIPWFGKHVDLPEAGFSGRSTADIRTDIPRHLDLRKRKDKRHLRL